MLTNSSIVGILGVALLGRCAQLFFTNAVALGKIAYRVMAIPNKVGGFANHVASLRQFQIHHWPPHVGVFFAFSLWQVIP